VLHPIPGQPRVVRLKPLIKRAHTALGGHPPISRVVSPT
jgi:hypothetical protein